jgi:hypothetical protein
MSVSILQLPTELIKEIFCSLPSISDVLALGSTCQRARCIWIENANSIFPRVPFGDVQAKSQAYEFFLTQAGKDNGSPLSAEEVLQIVRNYCVVENTILKFERQIVSRVTSTFEAKIPINFLIRF